MTFLHLSQFVTCTISCMVANLLHGQIPCMAANLLQLDINIGCTLSGHWLHAQLHWLNAFFDHPFSPPFRSPPPPRISHPKTPTTLTLHLLDPCKFWKAASTCITLNILYFVQKVRTGINSVDIYSLSFLELQSD